MAGDEDAVPGHDEVWLDKVGALIDLVLQVLPVGMFPLGLCDMPFGEPRDAD